MGTVVATISLARLILGDLCSLSAPYARFVCCFNREKKKLIKTLSMIVAELSDAEKQAEKSHTYGDWIEKLQVILYDAQDFLEELSEVRQENDFNINMEVQVPSFFRNPRFYIAMALKMKKIRDKLDDVEADRRKFSTGPSAVLSKDETKETHSFLLANAGIIIGREEDKKDIKQLLKDSSTSSNEGITRVSIIPIIGIGGLGKTSLAQLTYNDEEEDKIPFDLKIWVWVSTVFDVQKIVKKIIEAATIEKCPDMGLEPLQHRLREILDGKKYFLVLDDVWNINSERWLELKNLLMGGAMGSVILVTTRDQNVTEIMGTVSSYRLKCLSDVNCEALFKQLAFKPGQMEENPALWPIGMKILQRCEGVPLAIRTAASLLFLMDTESEWLNVKKQLWKLAKEDNHILPILRVSYSHLSTHLQKCFAYCSLFPKGYVLEKAMLIQLWMAQGFVEPSKDRLLEDTGEEYFKELWKRSLFQVDKVDDYGNVISCKMHDLMHDLAQSVAGFEFSVINDDEADISERTMHVSIDISDTLEPASLVKARKLRTFLCSGENSIRDFDSFASTFKRLLVLDLRKIWRLDALNSLTTLIRLRYLDLSGNAIETLPNSICELQHLQTLKLNSCDHISELPGDITKLVSLRHLENYGCNRLKSMPSGIGRLTSLRTLSVFVVGSTSGVGGLSELESLDNLGGELEITDLHNARSTALQSNRAFYMKNKKYIQTLTLRWNKNPDIGDEENDVALLESLQPNSNLKGLEIHMYHNIKLPSWMLNMGKSLPHLVRFSLCYSRICGRFPLFVDQLRFLKVLTLLGVGDLEFIGSIISDSSCSSTFSSVTGNIQSGAGAWLPALEEVTLQNLYKLKEWSREVVVGDDGGSPKTKSVVEQPKQLLSLNKLSKLSIIDCQILTSMPLHPNVEQLSLSVVSEALILSTIVAAATTSSLPSSVPLSNLKSLEIGHCYGLVSLPKGWLENLTSIERLKFEFCTKLKSLSEKRGDLQGFSSLSNGPQRATKLKELSVRNCNSLVTLFDWIGEVTSLKLLSISDCKKLRSLPRGLQHLTSLEKLEISNCPELNFSDEDDDMPGLRSLHSLKLSGLPKLVSLPKVLQNATAMKNLQIENCPGLFILPDWFGNLISIQQLEIFLCKELKFLPEGMQCLTALQKLTISDCPYLLETCRKETGTDWPKIAHIPEIYIDREQFWPSTSQTV